MKTSNKKAHSSKGGDQSINAVFHVFGMKYTNPRKALLSSSKIPRSSEFDMQRVKRPIWQVYVLMSCIPCRKILGQVAGIPGKPGPIWLEFCTWSQKSWVVKGNRLDTDDPKHPVSCEHMKSCRCWCLSLWSNFSMNTVLLEYHHRRKMRKHFLLRLKRIRAYSSTADKPSGNREDRLLSIVVSKTLFVRTKDEVLKPTLMDLITKP